MAGNWFQLELLYLIENEENMQRNILQKRMLQDRSDPFSISNFNFKKLFRLPKPLVHNLLEELNNLNVFEPAQRITAIPQHLKLLITLHFLAHGGYQTTVSEGLNLCVSQPTVSRILNEMTSIFETHLLRRYVKFPTTDEEIARVKTRFMNKFNFPNVIGAIDCTHIAIIAPKEDEENPKISYINRKGFYSINVQAICNSDLNITAVNARFPGSAHDSAIWTVSTIHQYLQRSYERGKRNMWLLGDAGYPLQPWLITPITDAPNDSPEGRFTSRHVQTRNVIERCFGVLKQRFRCLLKHRVLHYDHEIASKIIYTCVILHNICINNNIELDDIEFEDEEIDGFEEVLQQDWFMQGRNIRNQLINLFEQM